MAQISTKFIKNLAVTPPKVGSLAATSVQPLFADGSGGAAFRSIVAGDIPVLNQNTTGTASNITATSNSTLTTLSALTTAASLAISGSQVSGGTFGAINGSALTNLSAANLSGILPVGVTGGSGLSIATSQLTGNISLTSKVSGILPIANGGTNASSAASAFANLSPMTTAGDLIYENATPAPARLGIGSTGQVLTVVSGLPAWATPATSGTVTSVALLDGSSTPIYNISGSPVTSSGTLDFTLKTQTANMVFAGPATGSAAQPSFRSLVVADLSFAGAAGGVATLDGGGKVPLSQLPSTLMEFQGNWNPNTNTPALVDGTGTTGFTYWVSALDTGTVAGLTDPSMVNFQVGDLVIYNGTKWVLTTPAAGVSFVNGAQGSVVMSMATANGFAGTYSGTALTVSTTITGILQGNGTAISAASTTGSGAVVLATSPTLVTPNLGTPSAIVLTNASGALPVGVTGGSGLSIATSQLTGNISLTSQVSGILPIANGGTNASTAAAAFNNLNPMTTTGDLIYESATNVASRLGIGSTGQVLTVVGGVPAWAPTATALTVTEDIITLSSGDITAQFVDLAHAAQGSSASINSISLNVVGGPEQQKVVDYTVALTGGAGGVTRITFAGDLATGGNAALVAGDILMIKYAY